MRKWLFPGLLVSLMLLTGCQWDDVKKSMSAPFEKNIHGVPYQSEPPLNDQNTEQIDGY